MGLIDDAIDQQRQANLAGNSAQQCVDTTGISWNLGLQPCSPPSTHADIVEELLAKAGGRPALWSEIYAFEWNGETRLFELPPPPHKQGRYSDLYRKRFADHKLAVRMLRRRGTKIECLVVAFRVNQEYGQQEIHISRDGTGWFGFTISVGQPWGTREQFLASCAGLLAN
jgi:hypothetical protein